MDLKEGNTALNYLITVILMEISLSMIQLN